jgi:hypothetical protein
MGRGDRIGMTPESVEAGASVIGGYAGSLHGLADEVRRSGWASLSPLQFGLIPGNLVMTAGSVALAESAAGDITAAIQSAEELLGRLRGEVTAQRTASSASDGSYLLGFLSAADARALYDRVLADPGVLEELTPAQIAAFWQFLTIEQSDRLWQMYPLVVGNTSGVPLLVRMEANRLNATNRLEEGLPLTANEINYLEQVRDGEVQLVTFDPENHRIVEAINLATWDEESGRFVPRETPPTNVITYVPGTLSNLQDFYSGDNYQAFVRGLIGDDPGTVAFVYKDGLFPGETVAHLPQWQALPTAIPEASNQQFALGAGQTLAAFQADVLREHDLAGAQQTIVGHSWGLANITASEIAGAEYDQVISLAGAYMPDGWVADSDTSYSHYSYNDWLEVSHRLDNLAPDVLVDFVVPDSVSPGGSLVGSGDFPGDNPAFDRHVYGAPNDLDLIGNHDLIHDTNSPDNVDVIEDLREEIYG